MQLERSHRLWRMRRKMNEQKMDNRQQDNGNKNRYIQQKIDNEREKLLKLAAYLNTESSKGNIEAVYYLGCMYYAGKGVNQSFKKTRQMFRLAAEAGNVKAQIVLGKWYEEGGRGVDKNPEEVDKWVGLAVCQDIKDADALLWIAEYYKDKFGKKELSHQCCRKAAELGLAEAQFKIAEMYFYGRNVRENKKEAKSWYKKAVDQGHAKSEYIYGRFFCSGKEKEKYLCSSAEKGVNDASYTLGEYYREKRNLVEAKKWYERAWSQGDSRAVFVLGGIEKHGQGLLIWIQEMADKGDSFAQEELAHLYAWGHGNIFNEIKGIPLDYKKAIYWYEKLGDNYKVKWIKEKIREEQKELTKKKDVKKEQEIIESQIRKLSRKDVMDFILVEELRNKMNTADKRAVVDYLKQGVRVGDEECMYCLALVYDNGWFDIRRDVTIATRYYVSARAYKGQMNKTTRNLSRKEVMDYILAMPGEELDSATRNAVLVFLHNEADKGDKECMYCLGLLYEKGLFGIERNQITAWKWYEKAGDYKGQMHKTWGKWY